MSSEIYQDVNWEEIIPNLENAARNLAYSNNGSIFIQDVLPFIKTVRPKVASTDSLFYDMTLICLARRMEDEGSLVNEGLKPLIDSKILTEEEAEPFRKWFVNERGKPEKHFSIDGVLYSMTVDNYQGHRDLGLKVINKERDQTQYPFYCLKTGCSAFGQDGLCYLASKCKWVPNQPEERGVSH